ncbi:hypothetical protein [Vibrio mediterranei]|uniref:hypothetical protein n=1 Tax=Vibrio mediterranei TaxID=689 RepID=UPI001EFEABBC|nr:hypothetical protein [Vibrio mediterranei]
MSVGSKVGLRAAILLIAQLSTIALNDFWDKNHLAALLISSTLEPMDHPESA